MPLTQLDERAALIVIDIQKGIVALPTVHPVEQIVDRIAQLARGFRERSLPVVLANVAGRAPGRTRAEIGETAITADILEQLSLR